MSQYLEIQGEFRDLSCLLKALAVVRPEWVVETHEQPHALYGYQNDRREQKAEVIIRRHYIGQCSNDVGFARQGDGTYAAIISDFDRLQLNDAWIGKLKQAYLYEVLVKQQGAKYNIASKQQQENGDLRVVLRLRGNGA